MLFNFNKFWKMVIVVMISWVSYGIWGYEFTAITLLSLILLSNPKDNSSVF